MSGRFIKLIAANFAMSAVSAAAATPLTIAEARQSLVGHWQGKLEYRDYQADRWFGLPVEVAIMDGGDGVTQIRTAITRRTSTCTVRITTVHIAKQWRE